MELRATELSPSVVGGTGGYVWMLHRGSNCSTARGMDDRGYQ